MHLLIDSGILFLVLVANSAPVLAAHLFPHILNHPVDSGRPCRDGRPWLGTSKTWRGICSGIVFPMLVSMLMQWPVLIGLGIGMSAMLGDLISSFIKRRLSLAPEARATGLDQVPEALLPALIATSYFDITWLDITLITLAFMAIEMAISPLLYRLCLRKKPY